MTERICNDSEARMRAAELGFRADSFTCLRAKEDAVTWRCTLASRSAILKCYRGDYAGLGAAQRCRKSELAAAELRAADIVTPTVLAAAPDAAAVLFEDVDACAWNDGVRNDAAVTLRRLDELQPSALSGELRGLLAATEPNRGRIALGVRMFAAELDTTDPGWRDRAPQLAAEAEAVLGAREPEAERQERRLVHGDYFRANLLAAPGGVHVIDWDRFGLGDPAWDLGFLLAAEPDIAPAATEAALTAYGPPAPAGEQRLAWHLHCWHSFWALRQLLPVDLVRNLAARV